MAKKLLPANLCFYKKRNQICKIFVQMREKVKVWWKNFDNKTEGANNAKYFTLTPTGDAKNIEAYRKVMDFAFSQSDVRNIAVTGPYGAGKSSFLRTYFRNNRMVLWISLASFLCDSEGKEREAGFEESFYDEDEHRLELSILQQIFYKFKLTDVPYSRLCKIEPVGATLLMIRVVLIIGIIFCVVGVWQPEFLLYYFSHTMQEWLEVNDKCVFWCSAVILLGLLSFFAYKVLHLLSTRGIQRVDVSGLGIQMSDKTEKSVLNQNIDEIIYHFAASEYRIVVFEDIDRFNNVHIFTKLREVNLLLNNANQIKETYKPIRFIYALKEGLFADKYEKVKFFDLMIPIVPVVNASNSQHILYKFLEENCQIKIDDIWKKMIKGVSPFISDMRLLKNICNEFFVYKDQLPDCNLKVELLGMIIFKNFFPKEFVAMHQDDGVVKKVLEVKRNIQEKMGESINKKVRECLNEVNKIRDNDKDIEDLKKMYFFEMMKELDGAQTIQYKNEWLNVGEIIKKSDWFATLRANQIKNRNTGRVIDWKTLQRNFDPNFTYEECEKQIEDKKNGRIEMLMTDVAKLKDEQIRIKHKTLVDLWDEGWLSQEVINKDILPSYDKQEQDIFGILIRNGYLNERYPYYISIFYDTKGLRTRNDYYFEVAVVKGDKNDWDKQIDCPEEVIENIDVSYFKSSAILNYSLCRKLQQQFESDKARTFFTLITQQIQYCYEFTDGYLNTLSSQEEREEFLKHLLMVNNAYISELIQLFLRDSSLPRVLVETQVGLYIALMMQDEKMYSCSKELKEFIEKTEKITDVLLANGINIVVLVEPFLTRYGFKFATLDCDAAQKCGLLDVVIRKRAYRIKKDMIEKIFVVKGVSLEEFQIRNYSSIKKCKIQAIVDYIDDELEYYFRDMYALLDQLQEDEAVNILYVLNKESLSKHAKEIFIRKQTGQGRILDVKCIHENEVLELCLELNWIVPTWYNIFEVWNRIREDRLKICLFVNRPENYTVLANRNSCSLKWEECEEFATFIAEEKNISDDAMRALLLGMHKGKISKYTGQGATPKRVEYLIKGKRIAYSRPLYESLRRLGNDSHITLVRMNISDFCVSYESGMLNREELKKLLALENIKLNDFLFLVKTLQQLIVSDKAVIALVSSKINADNFDKFEHSILEAVIADVTSPDLQCKIIQFLDGDTSVIRERLRCLKEPYARLGYCRTRPLIPFWPERDTFIDFLKNKGIVSSVSQKENDVVQVNITNQ